MKIGIKSYLPIIYIYFSSILSVVFLILFFSLSFREIVLYFLGIFILIFSFLKIINFKGFVDSFTEYDFISQKIKLYAYLFPFFELIFGLLFLFKIEILYLEVLCLIFFAINLVSVVNALTKKKKFVCACLGGLFEVPLSHVSLVENITMIIGVLYLLIF